ncbi:MAG: hypothetical protein V4699_00370 [Patescibacteria group bacterium]
MHQRVRQLDEHFLSSLVFSVPPAFTTPDLILPVATAVKEQVSRLKSPWAASTTAPFLLLGYIGIGKSTYLEYFFLNEVKTIDPSIEGLIIDFKEAPANPEGFTRYFLDEIDKRLIEIDPNLTATTSKSVSLLYQEEFSVIESQFTTPGSATRQKEALLSETLVKAMHKHVPAMTDLLARKISYLRSRGKTIWIAIDNIDQHFYMLHQTAFVESIAIAYKLGSRLIISMRYLSLHSLACRHVYDSYVPRKLKLSLPNISEVILKRLAFFKSENKAFMNEAIDWTGGTLKVKGLADDIETAIKMMAEGDFLTKFLLPLSNYNIRRLLQMVLSMFQSYYFFYDRFNYERYVPNVKMIKKRFLYSHLLKNSDYFNPSPRDMQERCIINLFENEHKEAACNNTIRIRLLQLLLSKAGTVTLKDLTSQIQAVFDYSKDDIANALHAFTSCELIAITNVIEFGFDTSIFHERLSVKHLDSDKVEVALSFCGKMHFDLTCSLDYVEIMKHATYVDSKDYAKIQGEENQRTMNTRYRGTRLFLDYLAQSERDEIQHHVTDRKAFDATYGTVYPGIITSINAQFEALAEMYTNSSE